MVYHRLSIGLPEGHSGFANFEGGADERENERWRRFVTSALRE